MNVRTVYNNATSDVGMSKNIIVLRIISLRLYFYYYSVLLFYETIISEKNNMTRKKNVVNIQMVQEEYGGN